MGGDNNNNGFLAKWQKKLAIVSGIIVSGGIIFALVTNVYGWTQAIQEKAQQIEQNASEIAYMKCKNKKEDLQVDLKYAEKRLNMFNYEYVDKVIQVPDRDMDEFLGLPNVIDTLKEEIKNKKCGDK